MKLLRKLFSALNLGPCRKKCLKSDPDSKMCTSLRLLFFFNLMAGHWFAVSAFNIRPWSIKYILSNVVFFCSHSIMIAYTYFITFKSYQSSTHVDFSISNTAMSFLGVIGIFLAFWRTCCIIVYQSKVVNLIRMVMRSEYVDKSMVSKAARKCIWFMTFYTIAYFVFIIFGTISALQLKNLIYDTMSNSNKDVFNTTQFSTFRYLDSISVYKEIASSISPDTYVIVILLLNTACFVELFKFVLTDVINYFFYFITIDLYEKLEKTVTKILNSSERDPIDGWLMEHHFCNKFLAKVNCFTSPSVIATVICCTFQACITDYIVAKRLIPAGLSCLIFVLGSLAMMQIFLYCYFGHRIRALNISIHSATYRSKWLQSSKSAQNAAVMISNATGSPSQTLSQVGAPFFNLSIEFFTSILSAIATYFLILLQFK